MTRAYEVRPEEESVVTGRTVLGYAVHGRFDVLGGSMGAAHGERVVRAYWRALERAAGRSSS